MEPTQKTKTTIWGRSSGRCSFPSCRRPLILDASDTDDESLIGDLAHIVAESLDGPRGESDLTDEQRRKPSNLILLCKIHHKLVDDQPGAFPVDALKQMKLSHEAWVETTLSIDLQKQRDHETYADIIDKWTDAASIATWQAWTSSVFCNDTPIISIEIHRQMDALCLFLFGRIWPKRYPALEDALVNFGNIWRDLSSTFSKHARRWGDSCETEKFYKTERFTQETYDKLLIEYEFHVALIEDLLTELTRAGNYICDIIRETIDPSFRTKEGALLITRGPMRDLTYRHMRPEYYGEERAAHPYPGLDAFLTDRNKRDHSFGAGTTPGSRDTKN